MPLDSDVVPAKNKKYCLLTGIEKGEKVGGEAAKCCVVRKEGRGKGEEEEV